MSTTASDPPARNGLIQRYRYLLGGGLVLAIAGLAVGIAWFAWLRPAAPSPPTVDLRNVEPGVKEAIETARNAVKDAPESGPAWGQLGMVLRAHDFKVEAAPCFVQAEKLDPAEPRWPYHQAQELLTSDLEAGLACLKRAVERSGPVHTPRLLLGEVLLGLGRADEAQQHFRQVLAADKDNARAQQGLGRIAYAKGDLRASLQHLQVAVEKAPWNRGTHALLAEICFRIGEKEAAQEELRIVNRLRADTPWPDPYLEEVMQLRVGEASRTALASQLIGQDRTSQAIGVLQETVKKYPESYDAFQALGTTYLKLQPPDYPAAEQALREAVRLRPDDSAGQFHLGIALERQEKFGPAADCYRKAIDLKPHHPYAHYNLGTCLKQQGDRPAALQAYQKAVRYKPDFAEAHRDLGELLALNGQVGDALIHMEHAVRLNPADESARQQHDKLRKRN